jgi:hypothetical protein
MTINFQLAEAQFVRTSFLQSDISANSSSHAPVPIHGPVSQLPAKILAHLKYQTMHVIDQLD